MKPAWLFTLLFVFVALAHLCHSGVLWTEEGLPMAAAVQMLHGKALYRDVWFDKPPLVPGVYLLWMARTGWVLRIAGALYTLLCSWLAWKLAGALWSRREATLAAVLMAAYLTFGIPGAVLPLAADLLLIAPHLAALWLAATGRPVWAGVAAGIGLQVNAKAAAVLLVCVALNPAQALWLAAGFAVPNLAVLAWLASTGALASYWMQVWQLGSLYSNYTFVDHPVAEALKRTANWAGFHAAALAGCVCVFRHKEEHRWKLAVWMGVSLAAVFLGARFFPRYYFQLLPAAVVIGAHGLAQMPRRWRIAALLLLLIPIARFAPRYATLAVHGAAGWSDVAMDADSRDAAQYLMAHAQPSDTLFVWGYRPDVFVYTRMKAASRFLESQPISGVLADRHLFRNDALPMPWAAENEAELARSKPEWIVDGLALYNPSLGMETRAGLREWMSGYRQVHRTARSVIYRLSR